MLINTLGETIEKEVAVYDTWMKDDPSMYHFFILIIQFKNNFFDL